MQELSERRGFSVLHGDVDGQAPLGRKVVGPLMNADSRKKIYRC